MFEKFENSAPMDQDLFQDWADKSLLEAEISARIIKRIQKEPKKLSTTEKALLLDEPEV